MKRTAGVVGCIFVALAACGKDEVPRAPQLLLDREAVTFGGEFGNATYVGQRPQESIILENGGLESLSLSSSYSGDPAFIIEGPLKPALSGKERTFIRVLFAPLEEKAYGGTLTISSNAENGSLRVLTITGRGVQPPGDGGE